MIVLLQEHFDDDQQRPVLASPEPWLMAVNRRIDSPADVISVAILVRGPSNTEASPS